MKRYSTLCSPSHGLTAAGPHAGRRYDPAPRRFLRRFYPVLVVCLLLAAPNGGVAEDEAPRLVGEWELRGPLTLVWPGTIFTHRSRVPLFTELIQEFPPDTEVALVSPRPPSEEAVQEMGRAVRFLAIPDVRDIALREWAGHAAVSADGRLFSAQFIHRPSHLSGRAARQAARHDETGYSLGELLYGKTQKLPLVLNGAGLVHNGNGMAFISNRVVSENEHKSLQEIRDILQEKAGIDHLIFLPVAPGDEAGRVDGLVRFVAEQTVVVGQFPPEDEEGRAFTDRIEAQVRQELGAEFDVIPLPRAGGREPGDLFGNYLHFLQVDDRILLPGYGLREDHAALRVLKKHLPDRTVSLFESEELEDLAGDDISLPRMVVRY